MTLPAHWWKERAVFLDELYAATAGESGGEAGRKGWHWLTEHESQEVAARVRKAYEEDAALLYRWIAEEAHEASRTSMARAVPLAHRDGLRADRWARKLHNPTLFADPERPEQIWLALDETTPPAFWIPAGTSAESLARAWEPYAWPENDLPLPTILSLPKSIRIFVGTEQGVGADFDGLCEFVQSLPGADSVPWGTKFSEDPWPDRPTGIALIAIGHHLAEHTAQVDGAVPRLTFRSRRFGAAISLSVLDQFYVVEVQYAPVAHGSILETLCRLIPGLPKNLPTDIPVDALSVLARFRGSQAIQLWNALSDPVNQDDIGFLSMAYLATVVNDGAAVRKLLNELGSKSEPAERRLGYQFASLVGQKRFLYESLLHEKDPDNREALRQHLSPRV